MAEPQINQPTPQGVSDDTIKSFLAIPDDKKRDALGKMSPQTKQSLLSGMKAYKAKGLSLKAPAQPQPTAPPDIMSAMKGMIPGQAPPTVQPKPTGQPSIPIGQPSAPVAGTPFSSRQVDPNASAPPSDHSVMGQLGRVPGDIYDNFKSVLTTAFSRPAMDVPSSPGMPSIHIPAVGTPMSGKDIWQGIKEVNDHISDNFKQGKIAEGTARIATQMAPMAIAIAGTGGNPVAGAIALAESQAFIGPWLDREFDKAKNGDPIEAALTVGGTLGLPKAIHEALPKAGDVSKSMLKGQEAIQDIRATRKQSFDTSKAALIKTAGNIYGHVGRYVNDIRIEDEAKNPTGSIKPSDLYDTISKLRDKVTGGKMTKGELPATTEALKLIKSRGPIMTWNDLKQLRTSLFELNPTGVDSRILAEGDKFAEKMMSDRAKAINKGPQYEAYTKLTKILGEHNKSVFGDLTGSENDQEFFDNLSKASRTNELSKLNNDLEDLGLPKDYLQKLMDSHKNIHRIASTSGKGLEKGSVISKTSALYRHPVAAGIPFATAYGVLPPGGKLVGGLLAAAYAANIADRTAALGEMRELGGPPKAPPKGRIGAILKTPITGPSAPPTPGGTPPPQMPLGMSPSPTGIPPAPPGGPSTTGGTVPPAGTPSVPPVATSVAQATPSTPSTVVSAIADEGRKQIVEMKKVEAEAKPKTEPTVTKVAEGERGKVVGKRGKLVDTPEARAAKAAERTAKNREKNISSKAAEGKTGVEESGQRVAITMPTAGDKIALEDWVKEKKGVKMAKLLFDVVKQVATKKAGASSGELFEEHYKDLLTESIRKMVGSSSEAKP